MSTLPNQFFIISWYHTFYPRPRDSLGPSIGRSTIYRAPTKGGYSPPWGVIVPRGQNGGLNGGLLSPPFTLWKIAKGIGLMMMTTMRRTMTRTTTTTRTTTMTRVSQFWDFIENWDFREYLIPKVLSPPTPPSATPCHPSESTLCNNKNWNFSALGLDREKTFFWVWSREEWLKVGSKKYFTDRSRICLLYTSPSPRD